MQPHSELVTCMVGWAVGNGCILLHTVGNGCFLNYIIYRNDKIEVLSPLDEAEPGEKVYVEGYTGGWLKGTQEVG